MNSTTTHPAHVPTGHAHHFLSRLDRLGPQYVDLALALYRDQDLVDFILAEACLPEAAPRVALALGDADRGPFLVITRDGHFVTCLGEGMLAHGLPVITRAELGGHIENAREMRARKMTQGHCAKAPVARLDTPRRNGPCPCKSGKKFKRCCGDERNGPGLPRAA